MAPVSGAHYTEPAEGKVSLIADRRGLFRVNRKLLQQVNSIGDITVCTLPDHYPVEPGARLASMRIVPLVSDEKQIAEAERLCSEEKLLDLRPYHRKKIGAIITGSEIFQHKVVNYKSLLENMGDVTLTLARLKSVISAVTKITSGEKVFWRRSQSKESFLGGKKSGISENEYMVERG